MPAARQPLFDDRTGQRRFFFQSKNPLPHPACSGLFRHTLVYVREQGLNHSWVYPSLLGLIRQQNSGHTDKRAVCAAGAHQGQEGFLITGGIAGIKQAAFLNALAELRIAVIIRKFPIAGGGKGILGACGIGIIHCHSTEM